VMQKGQPARLAAREEPPDMRVRFAWTDTARR
jgi:hypothetical protein